MPKADETPKKIIKIKCGSIKHACPALFGKTHSITCTSIL